MSNSVNGCSWVSSWALLRLRLAPDWKVATGQWSFGRGRDEEAFRELRVIEWLVLVFADNKMPILPNSVRTSY